MSWREDLKRFNGPYYSWALENRRKFLTTELATEKALAKEVEGMVKDLSVSRRHAFRCSGTDEVC